MIVTCPCQLVDIDFVAQNLADGEAELCQEIAGREFVPGAVAAALYLGGGRMWTFWETVGNFAAAVGGYTETRPGVWQSWFMSTPEAWARGNQITERVAEIVCGMLADEVYVHRLETTTLATRTRARAWYERIGLHYESTACKASASGKDLVTYAALRT